MQDTRTGKVARLPLAIREEVNRRLLDNEPAGKILPWLNALPEVVSILGEDFEGLAVNDQNLSEWRKGGFQDWLKRRDRIEHTRELAQTAVKFAKAGGGNLTEGAAAILSGRILDVLEQLDDLVKSAEGETAEQTREKMGLMAEAIEGLTLSVSRLRKGDHNAETLRLNRARLDQSAEVLKLARDKFEMEASEKLLDQALRQKAEEINSSNLSNADKIAAMRKEAFKSVDELQQSGKVKIPKV
jgi:hypothetical protein